MPVGGTGRRPSKAAFHSVRKRNAVEIAESTARFHPRVVTQKTHDG
jgi:hypothetical protein